MARIFVTGSADGLGAMAAKLLADDGHAVVLHARNAARARDATSTVANAQDVLIGDASSLRECRTLAEHANRLGRFDAVIHNVAVGYREPPVTTADGLPHVFAVNTLAPYVLTCLMERPRRLIYLSSGLHRQGDASLKDPLWKTRSWDGLQAYADSKLHDAMLAFAIARRWREVLSNAVEPGWVATRMGGPNATDDLEAGPKTQAWLAVSDDAAARVTGKYFYHQKALSPAAVAHDADAQERLLALCASLSGIALPS